MSLFLCLCVRFSHLRPIKDANSFQGVECGTRVIAHTGIPVCQSCEIVSVFVYARFFSPLSNLLVSSIKQHTFNVCHFLCVSMRDGVTCYGDAALRCVEIFVFV